jgi:hypothetical protein
MIERMQQRVVKTATAYGLIGEEPWSSALPPPHWPPNWAFRRERLHPSGLKPCNTTSLFAVLHAAMAGIWALTMASAIRTDICRHRTRPQGSISATAAAVATRFLADTAPTWIAVMVFAIRRERSRWSTSKDVNGITAMVITNDRQRGAGTIIKTEPSAGR